MESHQPNPPPAPPQHNTMPPPPQSLLLDELIAEILSWLPVKSLMRFRCVCKRWKSLISDPTFGKLHLRRSARNTNILLMWERMNSQGDFLDLSVVPCSVRCLMENPSVNSIPENASYQLNNRCDYYVVGSCNGLVCWVDNLAGKPYRQYWFNLWNPATNLISRRLAYLRVDDCFRFSFGYDSSSDSYKIVAFRLDSKAKLESKKVEVKVCNLRDERWRDIHRFPAVPFPGFAFPGHNDGVYFNASVNWLAHADVNSDNYGWNSTITSAQMTIVSLDMVTETYSRILLPSLEEAPQDEPTIGVLKDCLFFSHDCGETCFVIWLMKEFGNRESWIPCMKFGYDDIKKDCLQLPLPLPLLPLCISENGDIVIMAALLNGGSQGIFYNRKDNIAKHIKLPDIICWSESKDYVESLVSPFWHCN